MQMKAVSPLISAVLLIAIVFALAAIVSPWLFSLTQEVTEETSQGVTQQITCQSTAYDFDTSFAVHGINYSLSGTSDYIDTKIVNTGTINLHTFLLEIEISTSSGLEIKHFDINATSQKTKAVPLKPGQSAILKANITEDLNGTLKEVKILNGVCPSNFIKQRI